VAEEGESGGDTMTTADLDKGCGGGQMQIHMHARGGHWVKTNFFL
jgi:2-polyprenyl-3-methyl-5-hydroxy-6-metoxy-1,4-benzoquinol methylase